MINIALYQPDIPQNTAAIVRLCACIKAKLHIIEPTGFNLEDNRFKRVVLDYGKFVKILRYENYDKFYKINSKSRIILITTKGAQYYQDFNFKKNDTLLFGRESAGVPKKIHDKIKNKLKIPMQKKTRSLNVSIAAAIVSYEAIKQTNSFPK